VGSPGALASLEHAPPAQIVDALFVAAGVVLDGMFAGLVLQNAFADDPVDAAPPSNFSRSRITSSPPAASAASTSVPPPTATSTTSSTSAGASNKSLPTPVASEAGAASPSSSPRRSINGTSLGLEHGDADVDASGESDPEADDANPTPAPAPSNRLTASPKLRLGGGSGSVLAHPTSNERGSTGERSPSPAPQDEDAMVVEQTTPAPAVTVASPSPEPMSPVARAPVPAPAPTHAPTLATLLTHLVALPHILPTLHAALRRRSVPLWPALPLPSTPAEFRARADQRRAHVVWARVLGGALDVAGLLTSSPHTHHHPSHLSDDNNSSNWHWFVRSCIEDALGADEEAGWLASGYLLLSLVRSYGKASHASVSAAQVAILRGLADGVERRWREVRDERRQGEMGEVVMDVRRAFEA